MLVRKVHWLAGLFLCYQQSTLSEIASILYNTICPHRTCLIQSMSEPQIATPLLRCPFTAVAYSFVASFENISDQSEKNGDYLTVS